MRKLVEPGWGVAIVRNLQVISQAPHKDGAMDVDVQRKGERQQTALEVCSEFPTIRYMGSAGSRDIDQETDEHDSCTRTTVSLELIPG